MATLNLSKCQTPSVITMDELLFWIFCNFPTKNAYHETEKQSIWRIRRWWVQDAEPRYWRRWLP